jgi:hypothetical protein
MTPDLGQARRFLGRIDPGAASFVFQTFTDAEKDKPRPDPLAGHSERGCRRLKGLAARNATERCGVFVMINEGDGQGRRAENVVRIRAVFLDADGQLSLDQLRELEPEPNIIVESSPGHFQAYWLVDGLPVAQFEAVQRRIAERFGTDHVIDPCRVMRVPGFYHKKGSPFRVHIVHESELPPYSAEQIRRAFPPLDRPRGNGRDHSPWSPELPEPMCLDRIKAELAGHAELFGEYESASERDFALASHGAKEGWSKDKAASLIRGVRAAEDDSKAHRADYLQRTVDRAYAGVGDDDREIARLAALSPFDYDRCRVAEAKRLNVSVRTLDDAVRASRRKSRPSGRPPNFHEAGQGFNLGLDLGLAQAEQAERLSASDSLLDQVADTIQRLGAAGVRRPAKIIYLALTSRLLRKPPDLPAHVLIKGTSAGGKNYLLDTVCRLMPDHAVYKMSGMSDRALAYLNESMAHRFIVIAEAAAIEESPIALALIRTLLSEGELRYPTVEKGEDGVLKTVTKYLEGPTGLIMTTTAPKIHEENETRHLTLNISDEWSQTARILAEQARLAMGKDIAAVDLAPWHDFQTWLVGQSRSVVIPFADHVAALIESAPVRVRRDFPRFLTLIKSHALLHQAARERDERGRIIATLRDYEVVHDLAGRAFAETAELSHPESVLQVVEAIGELSSEHANGVTVHHLIAHAKAEKWGSKDHNVLSRRCRTARARGLLVNLETHRGQLARYQLTEGALEPQTLFPTVDQVRSEGSAARPTAGRPPGRG